MFSVVTPGGQFEFATVKEAREQALYSLDFHAGRAVGGAKAEGPENFYGYYPIEETQAARSALMLWDGRGRIQVEALGFSIMIAEET